MKDFVIQLQLFTKCNLACDFCIEKDYRTQYIDKDFIRSIPEGIIKNYGHILKDLDAVYINSCGGEVFMDDLDDDFWNDIYPELINKTNILLNENFPNIKKIQWGWMSNMVFNADTRVKVERLLRRTKSRLTTSYDPIGRFKVIQQRANWLYNTNYFADYIDSITVTLTRPGILALLDNDYTFNYINANIKVDISYYVASTKDYKYYVPDDALIYEFFKYFVDNGIFNCIQVASLFYTLTDPRRVKPYCDCIDNNWYTGTDVMNNTCYTDITDESHYKDDHWKTIKDKSFEQRKTFTDDIRGCTYCEYNGSCQKMCYTMINTKGYNLSKECPLKKIYEYIKANPELIKKWRNFNEKHALCN